MIGESLPPRQSAAQTVEPPMVEGAYLDWSAVLAGSVFALAISFLLISFGAGLGLSLTSPYGGEGVSAAWLAIASGIWFAWVMVTGFGAGGYLAGRMRRRIGDATDDEVGVRDGAHGLMVWAVGALVSMMLAIGGVGGLLNAGASAVGSAAGTVSDFASEAVSSDYFANVMLRSVDERPETLAGPVIRNGVDDTITNTADGGTATAPARIDPAVQQEVVGLIARSASSGDMADRDRTYLAQLVAANTGLDLEAALARVDTVNGEISDARTAALEAIEDARVTGVVFGFIAAATLLIGAIAAFFSATAGGRHRDEGLGFEVLTERN